MDINKPVACVYQQFGIGRVSWLAEVPPDGTPLYIHPVKELTDEEIKAEIGRVSSSYPTVESLIDFAKAILKKAQEK